MTHAPTISRNLQINFAPETIARSDPGRLFHLTPPPETERRRLLQSHASFPPSAASPSSSKIVSTPFSYHPTSLNTSLPTRRLDLYTREHLFTKHLYD